MKTKFRVVLSSVLLFMISIALVACNNGEETANDPDKVELNFLSLLTPNLTEEFWDGAIERFEEKNPDIKIKRIQAPNSTGLNDNYAKELLASGDFPDILSNISYQEFAESEQLLEIPIDDDIKKIKDYESLMIDGKLYTMQGFLQPHTVVFYNKDLFAKAGITETPNTWDELFEVSEKLKENNITPLLAGGDWSTALTFSILTAGEVFGKNPNWYADKHDGKVSYTDENWMKVAENFKKLSENGYFNDGALSIGYEQLEQKFLNGEAAMYPMGSWFAAAEAASDSEFEFGAFAAPALDGGPFISGTKGTNFSVAKSTKHPEEAVKFLKFLILDPETHKQFSEADAMFSGLVEPINYEFTPLQQEIYDMIQEAEIMTGYESHRAGGFPVAGIANEYASLGQKLLLGNISVEEAMQAIDDYWEKNK